MTNIRLIYVAMIALADAGFATWRFSITTDYVNFIKLLN